MRSNTAAADALVRRMLSAHVVDDPDAPANLSVQLHPPPQRGGPEPLHRLYDGHTEVVRDRHPERILRALVGYLERFAPPDPDVLRLRAVAVRGPAGALLAPPSWRRRAPDLERRLRRVGLSVIDAPHAWLDMRTGDVLTPDVVPVDTAALRHFGDVAAPLRRADLPISSGPYRLRGWVLPSATGEPSPSRAESLVTAMGLARNLGEVGGRRVLALLAAHVRSLPVITPPDELEDADAAALLRKLLVG